jgi:hypothetical protein
MIAHTHTHNLWQMQHLALYEMQWREWSVRVCMGLLHRRRGVGEEIALLSLPKSSCLSALVLNDLRVHS